MLKTAEAVSIGHPDKTADYISNEGFLQAYLGIICPVRKM